MDRILVINTRRVSKELGFDVKLYEDLMENPKCQGFIKKYIKYLESTDRKDLLEFYNKTGIVLRHDYTGKYSKEYKYEEVRFASFDELGCSLINVRGLFPKRYSAHLVVITNANSLTLEDKKVYADGKLIHEINNESEVKELFQTINCIDSEFERFKPSWDSSDADFVYEKKYTLELYNFLNYNLDIENAEQLVLSPFGDVFVLKEDGTLLKNNKVYDKNVSLIWEQDKITKIILFEDNTLEYISRDGGGTIFINSNQVYYNQRFLAYLENKELTIILKDEEYSGSITTKIKGIDIFDFDTYEEELILYIGQEEIRFPIINSYLTVYNA